MSDRTVEEIEKQIKPIIKRMTLELVKKKTRRCCMISNNIIIIKIFRQNL